MKPIKMALSTSCLGFLLSLAACNSNQNNGEAGMDSTSMDNTQSQMQTDTMATDSVKTDSMARPL